jgi:hypothetical protein
VREPFEKLVAGALGVPNFLTRKVKVAEVISMHKHRVVHKFEVWRRKRYV